MSVAKVELEDFKVDELDGVDAPKLLIFLQALRYKVGQPIYITDGKRGGDGGAHPAGLAFDISDNPRGEDIGSRWRFLVIKALIELGITRIGDYDRHIHFDIDESRDQQVIWHGQSS